VLVVVADRTALRFDGLEDRVDLLAVDVVAPSLDETVGWVVGQVDGHVGRRARPFDVVGHEVLPPVAVERLLELRRRERSGGASDPTPVVVDDLAREKVGVLDALGTPTRAERLDHVEVLVVARDEPG